LISDAAIFLAALGITTLELVEAAAVGLALYSETRHHSAFLYVSLGVAAVFIPMFLLGALIALLPVVIIRSVAAVLLLYFGLRLVRSARRSVIKARKGDPPSEQHGASLHVTGFSVGAIEAFEAAIVLVALLPNGFRATIVGMGTAILLVVVATYALRNHVRRLKQADTKVVISALLLSFAVFWFAEIFVEVDDLVLVPLFAVFALLVYRIANRPS